jgi:Zn-dependent peptidase ImmA (M78 family)
VLGEVDEHGITLDLSELKANRFAAEFLVEEGLLKQEMRTYSITARKVVEKEILLLANLFSVPYETVVQRLYEIDAISGIDKDKLLNEDPEKIDNLRKRYSFPTPKADNRVVLGKLVDLAVQQYEKKRITFEKLTYLLSMCRLKPEEVGVHKPKEYVRPTDDELDSIMEE